jgi:hypothetical protein
MGGREIPASALRTARGKQGTLRARMRARAGPHCVRPVDGRFIPIAGVGWCHLKWAAISATGKRCHCDAPWSCRHGPTTDARNNKSAAAHKPRVVQYGSSECSCHADPSGTRSTQHRVFCLDDAALSINGYATSSHDGTRSAGLEWLGCGKRKRSHGVD